MFGYSVTAFHRNVLGYQKAKLKLNDCTTRDIEENKDIGIRRDRISSEPVDKGTRIERRQLVLILCSTCKDLSQIQKTMLTFSTQSPPDAVPLGWMFEMILQIAKEHTELEDELSTLITLTQTRQQEQIDAARNQLIGLGLLTNAESGSTSLGHILRLVAKKSSANGKFH